MSRKPYKPIQLPTCLCGSEPVPMRRLNSGMGRYEVKAAFDSCTDKGRLINIRITLLRRPEWLCGCEKCGIVGEGNLKRDAVKDFERQVQISVNQ